MQFQAGAEIHPHAVRVPMLKYQDAQSYLKTRNALSSNICNTYGVTYDFIETGVYRELTVPEPIYPGNVVPALKTEIDAEKADRLTAWRKEVRSRNDNHKKIYGMISDTLSPEGIQAVRTSEEFAECHAEGCPLKLWKIVTCTHMTEVSRVPGAREFARSEAKKRLVNLKMSRGQTLLEYRDIFHLLSGNHVALGGAEESQEHLAVDFMMGAAPVYDAYILHLQNNLASNPQLSMPKTVQEVYTQMLAFKLEDNSAGSYGKGSSGRSQMYTGGAKPAAEDGRKNDRCRNCGQVGHWAKQCPSRSGHVQDARKGSNGRQRSPPPDQKRDGKKVHFPKTAGGSKSRANGRANDINSMSSDVDAARQPGRSSSDFFHNFWNSKDSKSKLGIKKNWFIYDSGATGHMVNNLEYTTHSRELSSPMVFTGITGKASCWMVAELPLLGSTMFHSEAPLNIISGPQVETYYPVVFSQHQHYTIRITNELSFIFNFDKNANLYIGDLGPIISPYRYASPLGDFLRPVHMVSVKEMRGHYTKAEVERADLAVKMMDRLGHCSAQDLMRMLTAGTITGVPITTRDVERSLKIYGRPIPALQGKSTRRPAGKGPDLEPSARAEPELELFTDIFHACGTNILLTVCKPIGLLMVYHLRSMKETDISAAIGDHIKMIKENGYIPMVITLDPAQAHIALGKSLDGVPVKIVAPGTHVRIAERAIRVVKERMRSVLASLPFKLPTKLFPSLASYVVNRINCIPRLHGIESSARELFKGTKLNYKIDLVMSFGQYAQVYVNAGIPGQVDRRRTAGCIALMSAENGHRAWKFYKLDTGNIIVSENYHVLPTPDHVCDIMNRMCAEQAGSQIGEVEAGVRNIPEPMTDAHKPDGVVEVTQSVNQPISITPGTDEVTTAQGSMEEEVGAPPGGDEEQMNNREGQEVSAMHISMNKGLKLHGDVAREAMMAETRQLHSKGTFDAVDTSKLTALERKSIIHCSLFFKEKFDQDGVFVKMKARLVAGGNEQDTSLIGDVSSPTVLIESLLAMLSIAATQRRFIMSVDIEGAYLECDMEGPPVFMCLPPAISRCLVELDPELDRYSQPNRCIVVRLRKALYGCVQSGRLWYNKLVRVLTGMDYIMNPIEPCVFNKMVDGSQMSIAAYVDDLLVTHKSKEKVREELTDIGSHFAGYKVQDGHIIGHLGIRINSIKTGGIELDMIKYTHEAVAAWGPRKTYVTPGDRELFVVREAKGLDSMSAAIFHSAAARLLYLAKRTRPDILVEVSAMCSRVTMSTEEDWRKMDRVFGYLKGTANYGIKFDPGGKVSPVVYSDASHACHSDGTSRTGIIVMMGGGPIATASSKQKLVTRSSAEAELIGICDGATLGLHIRAFLEHQGHSIGPTILHEDNESTIKMVLAGKPTTKQSRHINLRYYFVKQHIVSGELVLLYCCTADMLADMCTKAQVGGVFTSIRDRVIHPVGAAEIR